MRAVSIAGPSRSHLERKALGKSEGPFSKSAISSHFSAGESDAEARELLWEHRFEACLDTLGKTLEDASKDAKSAEWKVAICDHLRRSAGCKVVWISERLNMRAAAGVSRGLKRLREGGLVEARKLTKALEPRIKS